MLHIGCAIWAYDGWANHFFPQGLAKEERLRSYARRLTAVEANTTFYAVPPLATVKKWAEDTPETFTFCPKFPKAITHASHLTDARAQTATFLGTMRTLGPRLGPLMIQLPPTFGPNRLSTLEQFLADLPTDLRYVVEVRHLDWFKPEHSARLDAMLTAQHVSRVVFDSRPALNSSAPEAIKAKERKPKVPVVDRATEPFVVLRYISSPVVAENDAYLKEWTPKIAAWLDEKRDVYFFAHCPLEELSPAIARDVYHRLAAVRDLPGLPWDAIEHAAPTENLSQLSLF